MLSAPIHVILHQTNNKLNTPFYNPSLEDSPKEKVEITNPTHPLFGHQFPVISVSNPPVGEANVFVQYRAFMLLKIPISATNLGPPPFTLSTKLSLSSLNELIKLFKETKELCHINLTASSSNCPSASRKKSGRK